MVVNVTPETAKRLNDLAAETGRKPDQLVEDALAGYLEDLKSLRRTMDERYDDLKNGRAEPIEGAEAMRRLREKSDRWRSRG